jgi:hypothetical protein
LQYTPFVPNKIIINIVEKNYKYKYYFKLLVVIIVFWNTLVQIRNFTSSENKFPHRFQTRSKDHQHCKVKTLCVGFQLVWYRVFDFFYLNKIIVFTSFLVFIDVKKVIFEICYFLQPMWNLFFNGTILSIFDGKISQYKKLLYWGNMD